MVMAGSSSSLGHLRKSKSGNIHRWKKPKEHSLITTVNVLSPKFGGFTTKFYDIVVDKMNKIFRKDIKFVSLDGEKVRYEMKALKKDYQEAEQQVFAPLLLVLCPTSLFILLLTCTKSLHPRVWASNMSMLGLLRSSHI